MSRVSRVTYYAAYYVAHKEKWVAYGATYRAAHKKEMAVYRAANKKKHAAYMVLYKAARSKTDIQFRVANYLRSRLWYAVKNGQKSGSAVRDLGISISEFMDYIAAKFQPGMSWDNYGKWHLDHVRPLSSFDLTDRVQFLKAVHYRNLQPLWAADNIQKGDH